MHFWLDPKMHKKISAVKKIAGEIVDSTEIFKLTSFKQ